ncbi:acyl-CoA thioesterase [Oricola cellulosilytica]|uniref:Acyl-CoA thioesterase n=1 Tax=Oricola cellulosilytica TaxID=1429082 RepID=A0A4R0P8G3_9HYPH|nr:thioesterase family protein [Oricola cellulosilytica]TCD11856.1 acyl-CoA thioesterase [Oricola cellulosilytica]
MAFTVRQKVLFRHCDPAGIVFFPRYFEMINDIAEAWFSESLNAPWQEMHRNNGVPTAQIEVAFKAPSRHGDMLEITLTPQKIGATSVSLEFVAAGADGVRFIARSTLVYINAHGRPERWPDELRERITREIGES